MPNIGPMELIIVLVIALIVLGPKRLPDAGKSLGKGIREFKDGIAGNGKDDEVHLDTAHAQVPTPVPAPTPAATAAPTLTKQPTV